MSLWFLFINWRTQPVYDFCWHWIIKHGFCQILCVILEFLNFWSNREGWDCFWQAKSLSRLSKITYLPKVSKKMSRVNLDSLKVSKVTTNFELLNVSKMSILRIHSPVMEKLEALNLNNKGKRHSKGFIGYPAKLMQLW